MGNENFAISQEKTSSGIIFTVKGRIDTINAVELGYEFDNAIKSGQTHLVLNMLRVEYLCSTGIRVILKAYKEAKAAGGRFGIEKPSECVKNVLGIVALDEMLIV